MSLPVELKEDCALSTHFLVSRCVKPLSQHVELKRPPIKWSERTRKYTCEFCQKAFVVKRDWEGHINSIHLKAKPFRCDACSWSSSHRGELQKHFKKCAFQFSVLDNLGTNFSVEKKCLP